MNNSEFLTPSEAAKYLKVCKATIYKLINTGKLPAVKVVKSQVKHTTILQKVYKKYSPQNVQVNE